MLGKVQQYNELKGFGFLLNDLDFRSRVFFHISSWQGDIAPKVKMRVTFDLAPSRKSNMPPQAVNVAPLIAKNADEFIDAMNGVETYKKSGTDGAL